MTDRRLLPAVLLALIAASGAAGTPSQVPARGRAQGVTAVVFYDQNGNGLRDDAQELGLPLVQLDVAGHSAQAQDRTGRVVVPGIASGTQTIRVRALPPFFVGPAVPITVRVPSTSDVLVPVTLPIGANRPYTYMAFGDSITDGDGSSDDNGYRSLLERSLLAHFGRAEVVNESIGGAMSSEGAPLLDASLARVKPAYTLILFGTNDWNHGDCQDQVNCFTVESLRGMVRSVRAARSLPVLATIIPANAARRKRIPPERNKWVAETDERIRVMAREEGVPLADLHAAFMVQRDVTRLFADHVHPNDRGYRIIADEFFRVITQPTGMAATSRAASGAEG